MIIKGKADDKYHVKKALHKMRNVDKWQYGFILEVYLLLLGIKGKRLEHCSNLIIARKAQLQQISNYVVVDAYFSK